MDLRRKRAHEPTAAGDGRTILVDRIGLQGVSTHDRAVGGFPEMLAPHTMLRTRFGHDAARRDAFYETNQAGLARRREAIGG